MYYPTRTHLTNIAREVERKATSPENHSLTTMIVNLYVNATSSAESDLMNTMVYALRTLGVLDAAMTVGTTISIGFAEEYVDDLKEMYIRDLAGKILSLRTSDNHEEIKHYAGLIYDKALVMVATADHDKYIELCDRMGK